MKMRWQGFCFFINTLHPVRLVALIQLGGIGYMTLGSFVILSRSATLSERRQQIGKVVFSMPEEFRIDKFIRSVIIFTLVTEAAGGTRTIASVLLRWGGQRSAGRRPSKCPPHSASRLTALF